MDLLKTMLANRQSRVVPVEDPKPQPKAGRRKPSKAERAKEHKPGSRGMRNFIIEETPAPKIVREHFDAIIEEECASSDGE